MARKLNVLAAINTPTLTPCHLDFMPRNLIRGGVGIVRVIHFEHARYHLPARDLVRLATRIRTSRPDLREAFCDSNGPLTPLDWQIIDWCTVIDLASLAAGGG